MSWKPDWNSITSVDSRKMLNFFSIIVISGFVQNLTLFIPITKTFIEKNMKVFNSSGLLLGTQSVVVIRKRKRRRTPHKIFGDNNDKQKADKSFAWKEFVTYILQMILSALVERDIKNVDRLLFQMLFLPSCFFDSFSFLRFFFVFKSRSV